MYTTISHSVKEEKSIKLNLVQKINNWVAKEQENYFALCGMLLIVGTGIASIPVAIATSLQLFVICGISAILAMMGNVMVISQQPLKTVVWSFIISISVNIALLVYLILLNFV